MNKQRFMKIMSWYLIISMIFEMLPTSLIAAAIADSGNDAQTIMTVNENAGEADPAAADTAGTGGDPAAANHGARPHHGESRKRAHECAAYGGILYRPFRSYHTQ